MHGRSPVLGLGNWEVMKHLGCGRAAQAITCLLFLGDLGLVTCIWFPKCTPPLTTAGFCARIGVIDSVALATTACGFEVIFAQGRPEGLILHVGAELSSVAYMH